MGGEICNLQLEIRSPTIGTRHLAANAVTLYVTPTLIPSLSLDAIRPLDKDARRKQDVALEVTGLAQGMTTIVLTVAAGTKSGCSNRRSRRTNRFDSSHPWDRRA